MTEREALRWMLDIMDQFGGTIHPYLAFTDETRQVRAYHCHGCAGTFLSRWPSWETPTLETFPHAIDCSYVAAVRASSDPQEPT